MAVSLLPSYIFPPSSLPSSHPLSFSSHLSFQSLLFLKQDLPLSFPLQVSTAALQAMSTEQAKKCRRRLNPDERIEVALRNGLSEDRSGIDSNPVYRKLKEDTSKPQYDAMWDFWEACVTSQSQEKQVLTHLRYKRKYPRSDLRDMKDMKHITEAVARSTPGRLDKETGRATVRTVRNKMRRLLSIWQRMTNFTIPPEVHNSVAPVSVPAGHPTPKHYTCCIY
jgi:hypothetical protein